MFVHLMRKGYENQKKGIFGMKKKFAAAFVAFALAMAMPAAAFAANSVEAETVVPNGESVIDTSANGNGMDAIKITGNTANVYANNFGSTVEDSQANAFAYATDKGAAAADKAVAKATEDNKAKLDQLNAQLAVAVTPQDQRAIQAQIDAINAEIAKAGTDATKAWTDAAKAYNKAVGTFANINGNEVINTFELQGDNVGGMTVTIVLDKAQYAGHTVTALILDENGKTIQKTLVVDKNGCIKIEKDGFCVWTLVDCSGGLPAGVVPENGVQQADFEKALNVLGNATDKGTSPKTGC